MTSDGDGGLAPIRRIVTGHDGDGWAVVTLDGPAPNRAVRPRGTASTLIWGTDGTPAEIWSAEDFRLRDNTIAPPPGGSWFRIMTIRPAWRAACTEPTRSTT